MTDVATIRKRDELARLILSTNDKELIEKALNYVKELLTVKNTVPCQTWEEVVEDVEKQIHSYEKGELKTISHEEVSKIVEGWK